MGSGIERIETDRLRLRHFSHADRDPFAALNADPEVTANLSGPMSRAESDAFVDRIEAHWETWGYGLYAVDTLDAQGAGSLFIGFVGLSHHRALPDDVEIGWRLARHAWGRGLATEGAIAVRELAFAWLGLDHLVSITTDENVASRRVMDKLGFRYDRHLTFEAWNLRIMVLDRADLPDAQGPRPLE